MAEQRDELARPRLSEANTDKIRRVALSLGIDATHAVNMILDSLDEADVKMIMSFRTSNTQGEVVVIKKPVRVKVRLRGNFVKNW